MKKTKSIERWRNKIADVVPKANDPSWSKFFHDLREFIAANVGYTEAKSLEFSRDDRMFRVKLETVTRIGKFNVDVHAIVIIDPFGDLVEAVKDLTEHKRDLERECRRLQMEAEKKDEIDSTLLAAERRS